MRWISALCVGGLLAAVGAGTAMAADLAVRPQPQAIVVVPVNTSSWSGFYLGINGGGGWGQATAEVASGEEITFRLLADAVVASSMVSAGANLNGAVFGGQFGYNWQFGQAAVGIEGDIDWVDLKQDVLFPTNGFVLREKLICWRLSEGESDIW